MLNYCVSLSLIMFVMSLPPGRLSTLTIASHRNSRHKESIHLVRHARYRSSTLLKRGPLLIMSLRLVKVDSFWAFVHFVKYKLVWIILSLKDVCVKREIHCERISRGSMTNFSHTETYQTSSNLAPGEKQ